MNTIRITESKLKQIVNESVNKVLKESYNNPDVINNSSSIKENVREYLNSLESIYGDDLENCGNEFLKDVFKNGWVFFNSLSSFINDEGQQEIYKY